MKLLCVKKYFLFWMYHQNRLVFVFVAFLGIRPDVVGLPLYIYIKKVPSNF